MRCRRFCSCREHPNSTRFRNFQFLPCKRLKRKLLILGTFRASSPLALGAGGRRFESCRPDQQNHTIGAAFAAPAVVSFVAVDPDAEASTGYQTGSPDLTDSFVFCAAPVLTPCMRGCGLLPNSRRILAALEWPTSVRKQTRQSCP